MEASMTPGHRQWKKSILTGGALCAAWWPFPPFIWNSNTSLGLNLFILIWTTPLGLNVTSAIPPFIYSVGPGNHFMLLDPDVFFALFFVAGNFRSDFSCHPFLFRLICLVFLKMGRRPFCPDGDKKKKKKKSSEMDKEKDKDRSTRKETKQNTSPGGGSAHKDQSTGNYTADTMMQCINEINQVKAEAAANNEPPKLSRNEICKKYGLAPGTVSKRMTGKVKGLGPWGGGAWRGRVFNQG